MDPIFIFALFLFGAAFVPQSPFWSLGTFLVSLFVLHKKHFPKKWLVFCVLAFGMNLIRTWYALGESELRYSETRTLLSPPSQCEGDGVIVNSPIFLHGAEMDPENPSPIRADVDFENGTCNEKPIPFGLRARIYGFSNLPLNRGDRLHITVNLAPIQLFLNDGSVDARYSIARNRMTASGSLQTMEWLRRARSGFTTIDRFRFHVRQRIQSTFHPEAEALARALVLGETDLDSSDLTAFQQSGLSHLLAVSGTHLVIVVVSIVGFLQSILVRLEFISSRVHSKRIASAIGIPISSIFWRNNSLSSVISMALISTPIIRT